MARDMTVMMVISLWMALLSVGHCSSSFTKLPSLNATYPSRPFAANSSAPTVYSRPTSSADPPMRTVSKSTRSPAGFAPSNENVSPLTHGNLPSFFGHCETPFSRSFSKVFPVTDMTTVGQLNGRSLLRSPAVKGPAGYTTSARRHPLLRMTTSLPSDFRMTSAIQLPPFVSCVRTRVKRASISLSSVPKTTDSLRCMSSMYPFTISLTCASSSTFVVTSRFSTVTSPRPPPLSSFTTIFE
mmetsp:Transcript_20841/g.67483  ORF Transcript_20841/g.67483 Transcript_20841/m.67483 type:complete len:241 (+) Transcript_20841:261-983(+)